MIMAISQRVFVGEPLCRSEQWVSRNRHVRYTMLIDRSCIASCKLLKMPLEVHQSFGITMGSQDHSQPGATRACDLLESTPK